jgi:molybdopterin synthase catalytic subunit/molybdopterin converting factor small subunit
VRIVVRLFALQRQQLGTGRLELDVPEGSTIDAAWQSLTARHPVLDPFGPVVRFARNGAYAEPADRLEPGDELAVIPPVAGGSTGPDGSGGPGVSDVSRGHGEAVTLALTAEPIDSAAIAGLHAAIASDQDGAVVLFSGRTRRTPGTPAPGEEAEAVRHAGQSVEALEYEAYESMALDILRAIQVEVRERFGVERLAILHRVGVVPLGATSVAVVAAAPHREAAFDAARYAIDELKARAPIWKSERFADGSVWLGAPARTGPPATVAAARRQELAPHEEPA